MNPQKYLLYQLDALHLMTDRKSGCKIEELMPAIRHGILQTIPTLEECYRALRCVTTDRLKEIQNNPTDETVQAVDCMCDILDAYYDIDAPDYTEPYAPFFMSILHKLNALRTRLISKCGWGHTTDAVIMELNHNKYYVGFRDGRLVTTDVWIDASILFCIDNYRAIAEHILHTSARVSTICDLHLKDIPSSDGMSYYLHWDDLGDRMDPGEQVKEWVSAVNLNAEIQLPAPMPATAS